jgi:membrane-associated protease RseP (regulator of RpoE activity)
MPQPSEDDSPPIPAEVSEVIPADDWRLREYAAEHPFPPYTQSPPPRRRIRLPVLLFILTFLSTFYVYRDLFADQGNLLTTYGQSFQYSFALMTILFCHEMGHFLQAHRYRVRSSLPYFIPMPFSPFGTMGAVIVMPARIGSRRSLFDIGISGPLAGLVPTMIFVWIGIKTAHTEISTGKGLVFPEPLLFEWLTPLIRTVPQGHTLFLNPFLTAGWVGMFITFLNLIPIGQLDGGHVLYALLRRRSYPVVRWLIFSALVAIVACRQWDLLIPYSFLLFLLSIFGLFHPPTADDYEDLGWPRTVLGILILLFIPIGFTLPPTFQ